MGGKISDWLELKIGRRAYPKSFGSGIMYNVCMIIVYIRLVISSEKIILFLYYANINNKFLFMDEILIIYKGGGSTALGLRD